MSESLAELRHSALPRSGDHLHLTGQSNGCVLVESQFIPERIGQRALLHSPRRHLTATRLHEFGVMLRKRLAERFDVRSRNPHLSNGRTITMMFRQM